MAKIFSLVVMMFFSGILAQSQPGNVGVGKANPAEKLDVAGNINVDGTIKVNGVDGTANQVLMKNGAGTLAWGSLTDFKNFKQFRWAGNGTVQTFTVPTGVTRIAVELWGGGGGGSEFGGGGAGGYALVFYTVYQGGLVNIVVGTAGTGSIGANPPTAGTLSSCSFVSSSLSVNGGNGAVNYPGMGGGISSYSGDVFFMDQQGQTGRRNFEQYQQMSAADFVLYTKYGNGGTAYGQMPAGGEGGYTFQNLTNGFIIKEVFGGQGYGWGEGGGGGKSNGYSGGYGRVIVRW